MNRTIIKPILLSLILVCSIAFTAAGAEVPPTGIEKFYNFFNDHLIGNTLVHQHYMPIDNGQGEKEVTRQDTYTNLTRGEDTLSFDVFSVVTHANYRLDPDGKRRNETRSVFHRGVSLTRYTVHSGLYPHQLTGISRCLSHTNTELIGSTATIQLWFYTDTLKLVSSTLLPLKRIEEVKEYRPVLHINVRDFWVEDQQLLSRSLSQNHTVNATTSAASPQAPDAVPSLWREEKNKTHFHQITDPIQEREDHLIEAIKKSGAETTFLVMQEGYLYPCKIVGEILESFPLQADMQTHHHDASFRTVFYKLLLPNEVEVSAYTMEILSGTDWKPVISFKWDSDTFHSKTDEASESKKHTINQIRFKKLGGSP